MSSPARMDAIEFTWQLDRGANITDSSPESPLHRAFRSPFHEGRPYETHAFCVFVGQRPRRDPPETMRWLGVLVLSAQRRIIFFPGLAVAPDWIQTQSGSIRSARQGFDLDHLTLDPERQEWHFTSPGSEDHVNGGRTRGHPTGEQLWFGMSAHSPDILRALARTTIVRYPVPPSDVERRLQILSDAERHSSIKALWLPEGSQARFPKGFMHFCFIVGPRGFRDYHPKFNATTWLLPDGSSFTDDPLPESIPSFQVDLHRVHLGPSYDVQIATMWMAGSLNAPIVYTTPARKGPLFNE